MGRITCYGCGKPGHYKTNCPEKSSGNQRTSFVAPMTTSTPEFPPIYCPCGAGVCIIKPKPKDSSILHYFCPGKYEMHCHYVRRCDKLKLDPSMFVPPRKPYPICSCKGGVCRVEEPKYGPYPGRKYFACRVPKGEGACSFRLWMDEYYSSEFAKLDEPNTIAGDDSIRYEIQMIQNQFAAGDIDPQQFETDGSEIDSSNHSSEETLVEMEFSSSEEIHAQDVESSCSHSPEVSNISDNSGSWSLSRGSTAVESCEF